jgi:hypothetical protein
LFCIDELQEDLMKVNIFKKLYCSACVLLLLAISVLVVLLPAGPLYAHAPDGVGDAVEVELEPVLIYNGEGELLEITIDELAELEGNLCVCIATSFRVIRTAIEQLYQEDEIPSQGEISAVYRHPGKGHKKVFEYVFTPEFATYEKTGNPQQMTVSNWVYTFTRLDTGEVFETQVRDGVIAEGFFDLRYKVNGYENGWHEDEPTEGERAEWITKWSQTRDNFLTMPSWDLYTGVEEPEEPVPVIAVAFSGVLIVSMLIGFVYSGRGKKNNRR